MRRLNINTDTFFSLLRAGLWEQEVELSQFEGVDYSVLLEIAQEQSVVGLVAAGLEHVNCLNIPKEVALEFVGNAIQIEQRNRAMNGFIASLVDKMRASGIYALLAKGQGIAQCYSRPLWRTCGDVDFFLSNDNYHKASALLSPLASCVEEVDEYKQHLPMTIDNWVVELHGTLRGGLWKRMDHVLDCVQEDVIYGGKVRSWMNDSTQVFLLGVDEDIAFVFSHILQHFFRGGIGLRQLCDWCRLLWTYRDSIDFTLLEKRLCEMGAMTEWKAFAALAVDSLGMPVEAMPFYSPSKRWSRKARRILLLILETGNFGQNRDLEYQKHSFVVRKAITLWRLSWDSIRQMFIFPIDPIRVWSNMFVSRMKLLVKA